MNINPIMLDMKTDFNTFCQQADMFISHYKEEYSNCCGAGVLEEHDGEGICSSCYEHCLVEK